jgi:hypothetical protein
VQHRGTSGWRLIHGRIGSEQSAIRKRSGRAENLWGKLVRSIPASASPTVSRPGVLRAPTGGGSRRGPAQRAMPAAATRRASFNTGT